MIGCFPDPYPDEILYSIYARYKERMLYLDDTAIYKLVFGSRHNRPQLSYDEDELDYLVSELQPGYSYSVARLKCEHTLTPIYKLGSRIGKKARRGLTSWEDLKLCPICYQEDSEKFGEPFWHRSHQVPGVEVCQKHRIFLHKPQIQHGSYILSKIVPASQFSIVEPITPLNLADVRHQFLMTFADNVAWLLEQKKLVIESVCLSYFYIYLLATQGYLGNQSFFDEETLRFDTDYLVKGFVDWSFEVKEISKIIYGDSYNTYECHYEKIKEKTTKRHFQEDFFRYRIIDKLILRPLDISPSQNLVVIQFLMKDLTDFIKNFLEFQENFILRNSAFNTIKCHSCQVERLVSSEDLRRLSYDRHTGVYLGKILCLDCYRHTFFSLSVLKDFGFSTLKRYKSEEDYCRIKYIPRFQEFMHLDYK